MNNILMIGPDMRVKGGISSVIKGYMDSSLNDKYHIINLASHLDYKHKFKKVLKAMLAYLQFVYHIISKDINIVHIHTSFGGSFYRKAVFIALCRVLNIKCINHIHGAEFDKFYVDASQLKKKMVKKIYSLSNCTIVLSNEWKKNIEAVIGLDKKIEVVKNFAVIPKKPKVYSEKEEEIVLYVGEVGRRKGAYDMPMVVQKVVEERKNVKFIFCGNGDIEKVARLMKQYGVENNVEFTGWIGNKEKEKWLNKSKVFILPSYNEGLPMAILEAMSYGLPIVSTEVGGIPSLVEHGQNGYLTKAGNVDDYAKYILKILKNQKNHEVMSNENRKKIENEYSLENISERISQIYESVS